jgi:hypothetical protein
MAGRGFDLGRAAYFFPSLAVASGLRNGRVTDFAARCYAVVHAVESEVRWVLKVKNSVQRSGLARASLPSEPAGSQFSSGFHKEDFSSTVFAQGRAVFLLRGAGL